MDGSSTWIASGGRTKLHFNSLGHFGLFLGHLVLHQRNIEVALLHKVSKMVLATAKAKIGTSHQPAYGRFAAWPPLSPYTIDDRLARGYSANELLLRRGDLYNSYGYAVDQLGGHYEAIIGSTSKNALWQEVGTSRGIPARSVLGAALEQRAHEVVNIIGDGYVGALVSPAGMRAEIFRS